MGKIISKLIAKPIYTYLYGLAFFCFKTSAYIGNFEYKTALIYLICFFILTFFIDRLVFSIIGSAYSALFALVIWMSVFHVVGIAQKLGYPYAYIPLKFYLTFYFFVSAFLISIGFILVRKDYPSLLSKVLNVFFSITILVFFIDGIKSWFNTNQETLEHEHQVESRPHHDNKEIVWILMDEYGSSKSLEKLMGFQNPMDSLLKQRGFEVFEHAISRSSTTLFSVYSIFNLDDSVKPSSYYEGINLLRNSKLVPSLEKEGYRFVNLGFFDISGHSMITDRSGYPYTYLQQILSGTLVSMIHSKWKNSIVKCDAYNQDILQKLDDSLSAKSVQKRFIWAHLTIPHEPFCRDSLGNLQEDKSYVASDSTFIKTQYISYLKYGNKRVIQLLDKHPDLKEKIVIISGDHGPRYPFFTDKTDQLHPYLAIRYPNKYSGMDNQGIIQLSKLPLIIKQFQYN